MNEAVQTLFSFFGIFVLINATAFFFIQLKMKEKVFKSLFSYWLLVLLLYAGEALLHQNEFVISVVFLLNLPPIYVFTNILLSSYKEKLQMKNYIVGVVLVLSWNIIGHFVFKMPFVYLCLPVALLSSLPAIKGLYVTFIKHRSTSEYIQKITAGTIFPLTIFCCFNYAINRLTPGTELVGWASGFFGYVAISILLPVFTINELHKERTLYLESLVEERTQELIRSREQKERMLKVLAHDISNSLQTLILHNERLSDSLDEEVKEISQSIGDHIDTIISITKHVKAIELSRSVTIPLDYVVVADCLLEIEKNFTERFKSKGVKLHLSNEVSPDSWIFVDKVSFVHSVISNIVSNALKFSHHGSTVAIRAYETEAFVKFEIKDSGLGINPKMLETIFEHDIAFSTLGTQGEIGTGFGLPLVKNYTEAFGGSIQIVSNESGPNQGTIFTVTLPRVSKLA